MISRQEKGFSLLVLSLILVAIVIVSLGAIYLINPVEKARESRDQRRLDDIDRLQKAVKLYLRNNASNPKLCDSCTLGQTVFAFAPISINSQEALVVPSTSVGGPGWVPIDLSLNAGIGKTPILLLPIDPINKAPYVYTFTPGGSGKFKITASFESKALVQKMADDAGTLSDRYEIGTDLSLAP